MSEQSPKPPPLPPAVAEALGVHKSASEQDVIEAAEYRRDLERKHLDVIAERDAAVFERDRLARRLYQIQRRAAGRKAPAQPGQEKD